MNVSAEELKEQFGKIVAEELPADVNSDEQFLFVLGKNIKCYKRCISRTQRCFFLV